MQKRKELHHENAIFYIDQAVLAIREKKLLNYEDSFNLAQLYELRATQGKILGLQQYENDLITAQQYYEEIIDHFKEECKSLTGNIQKSHPGTQEAASFFKQRAEMYVQLQQTYNRYLKVMGDEKKAIYEEAVKNCKRWQHIDIIAYYDNTIQSLSRVALSPSDNIEIAKKYQELALYKKELKEPYNTEINHAMTYYLHAAILFDTSIKASETAKDHDVYRQLSDFYAQLSDCASQDPSRIVMSGHYLELAKTYATINVLLKESKLPQPSYAVLRDRQQLKKFQALQAATQDLKKRKSNLNISTMGGDAYLNAWVSQFLDFWMQQSIKNTLSLTPRPRDVGHF